MNAAIALALDTARPQLDKLIDQAKENFVASFGDWVASSHRTELGNVFASAGRAKLALLQAESAEEVQEAQETFDTLVEALETIALADAITAKALARAVMKTFVRQVLDTLAAFAGTLIGAVANSYVPGSGALVGPGVTAALQGLVASQSPKLPVLA